MKDAPLIDRLHALAEEHTPGPDPAFVARLGSELHQLDQVPVVADRTHPRARRLGGSTWLRVVTLAVPAGAVALAGAFVALRPAPAHPRQVRTLDPGLSTPAPDVNQPAPGEHSAPALTPPVTAPRHDTQSGTVGAPATTTTVPPTRHLVVPAPTDQSPQTTVAPGGGRSPEPTTSTTTAPTTTTTPPATLSLHCTGGTDAGTPAVTCTWSPITSSAFKSYRLSREKPGTNRVVVFTTDNRSTTSYADHDVQTGTGYGYWVEALDANGNVIARGATTITCC
ncbi:MAG TPA: hypothetical protein VFA83_08585 [Acidimicrobiales bacterium]|nr:hypothetical protein [Acidimicrobiales bacterium]